MIRLAISCDICGAEKKQTNHWFVAYEQGGELRIGGWASRFCKKAGARHLCGQTCLHKLVDEFMAQTIAEDRAAAEPEASTEQAAPEPHLAAQHIPETQRAESKSVEPRVFSIDASLTSSSAYDDEFGSSARLITNTEPVSDTPVAREAEAAPKHVSHQWRADAWQRERERGQHNEAGSRRHKF